MIPKYRAKERNNNNSLGKPKFEPYNPRGGRVNKIIILLKKIWRGW